MRAEHGKLEGDLEVIDDEFALHGMVAGDIVVRDKGALFLHGMCSRNLILEPGSRVELHGMVVGDVVNRGGVLRVFGMIVGLLRTEAGDTEVSPDARIIGEKRPRAAHG